MLPLYVLSFFDIGIGSCSSDRLQIVDLEAPKLYTSSQVEWPASDVLYKASLEIRKPHLSRSDDWLFIMSTLSAGVSAWGSSLLSSAMLIECVVGSCLSSRSKRSI